MNQVDLEGKRKKMAAVETVRDVETDPAGWGENPSIDVMNALEHQWAKVFDEIC